MEAGPHQVYDARTIALHWAVAVLVTAMWMLGQGIDWFPKGAPRMQARSVHILAGVVLALLLVVRVVWRLHGGRRLAAASPGWAGRLQVGGHLLLYSLLLCTVALGLTSAWVRGDSILGLFTIPAFDPNDHALREEVVDWHGLAANSLLALAALHAAFALFHHFVRRDGVLQRMWPASRPARSSRPQ
jgi:cytochrome b561